MSHPLSFYQNSSGKNNNICKFALTLAFISIVSSIQFTLNQLQTCMTYSNAEIFATRIFSFHCDQTREPVNLVFYGDHDYNKIAESGNSINYQSYIEVKFDQIRDYKFCFEKQSTNPSEVGIDVIEQINQSVFAGKQDLNKVARRISRFLVDIRKTGFELKQVLNLHIKAKQTLKQISWSSFRITILKSIIMAVIVAMQVYVVKKIYE